MKLYSDTSMIYEGMANSLFLVEGTADAVFNGYIRDKRMRIASSLRRKGVDVERFNIVSPATLDSGAVRELILRQHPMLDEGGLLQKMEEYGNSCKAQSRSRLMFIGDVGYNAEGCSEVKVFCEDDLGTTEVEFSFKMNAFLSGIAEYYAGERKNTMTLSGGIRYKFPDSYEQDALREQDNYECLCNDILAESICGCGNAEVSPIMFDDDFNISLPLYPNVSITLEPLPKALYILFLHHPEGIVLKDIQSYETEFKRIYIQVSGRKNPTVINRMFRAITDPTENLLHQNLSIIRRSFTSKLNYNIACNYIPAHGRTKAHNIPLESEYVILPEIA